MSTLPGCTTYLHHTASHLFKRGSGLRHLVMWNITAFGGPDLAGFSFQAMKQLKAILEVS